MPKAKLSDAVVAGASLPEGANEAVYWDTEVSGFGLRVRPGAKTYVVSYRPIGGGRAAPKKRLKLGTPQTIKTAQEARRLAREALGKVAAGGDPAGDRAAQKRREKNTVAKLLDRYEADLERRNYVNRKTVMSGLRTRLAALLEHDISEVTGAELAGIVEKLERAGKEGAAQDFRSRCRAFMTYAHVKAKAIPANPMLGLRKERATRAEKVAKEQHGRALSDAELVKVWRAADPFTSFGRLIRFLILTGCRRGEAAGLTRSMVNLEEGLITLPAVFTKQGRGHVVPIALPLAGVLEACVVDSRTPDLLFPSPRSGGPFKGWSKLLPKFEIACGVRFGLHDLRRTFRSGLSRLRVSPDVAELALGHARVDLEAIYNRDTALEELRSAFNLWAGHVERLTAREAAPAALGGVFA